MELKELKYNSNRPSFGWHIKTHEHMTKLALSEIPELLEFKKYLVRGSVWPDLSPAMSGLFTRKHLYNGQPISGKDEHALDMFRTLFNRSIHSMSNGKMKFGMHYAGNALHFLQDAMCPVHHTQQRFLMRISDSLKHMAFERRAVSMREDIEKLYLLHSGGRGTNKPFIRNFRLGYRNSMLIPSPKISLTSRWSNIIEYSYLEAIERSKNFLLHLLEYKEAAQANNMAKLRKLAADEWMN